VMSSRYICQSCLCLVQRVTACHSVSQYGVLFRSFMGSIWISMVQEVEMCISYSNTQEPCFTNFHLKDEDVLFIVKGGGLGLIQR